MYRYALYSVHEEVAPPASRGRGDPQQRRVPLQESSLIDSVCYAQQLVCGC